MSIEKADHRIDEAVGRNIRALRIAEGISQNQLAVRIGVTFQQVQKYETAANRVSASKLLLIAQTLQVPVEDFYAGLDMPGRPSQGDHQENAVAGLARLLATTSGGFALARAFIRIGPGRSRRALVDLAEAVAEYPNDNAPLSPS